MAELAETVVVNIDTRLTEEFVERVQKRIRELERDLASAEQLLTVSAAQLDADSMLADDIRIYLAHRKANP